MKFYVQNHTRFTLKKTDFQENCGKEIVWNDVESGATKQLGAHITGRENAFKGANFNYKWSIEGYTMPLSLEAELGGAYYAENAYCVVKITSADPQSGEMQLRQWGKSNICVTDDGNYPFILEIKDQNSDL